MSMAGSSEVYSRLLQATKELIEEEAQRSDVEDAGDMTISELER